mmetsp:Transcript_31814/g.64310  ORF Transcript_31814/g.64310 Transcript_31814/m.64310 type:complete len:206 (+) Transcript_31814:434-1051(+)
MTLQVLLVVPSKLFQQLTRKLWRYNATCSQVEVMVGLRNCALFLVQMVSPRMVGLMVDVFCPLQNCASKMRRASESSGERNGGEMWWWLGHLTPRVLLPGKNPTLAARLLQLRQNLLLLQRPKREKQPPLRHSSKMLVPPHQRRRRLNRRRLKKRKKRKILETKRLSPRVLMILWVMSMKMKSFLKKKRLVKRVLQKKQGRRHVS